MTVRSDDPTESQSLPNRIRTWGPAVSWAFVIFVLSALPNLRGAPSFPFSDKIAHVILYAGLGAALAWGWARSPQTVSHVALLIAGALYGITDEWHQMYVPGRTPDLADWIADVVGVLLGYGVTLNRVERVNGTSKPRKRRDV